MELKGYTGNNEALVTLSTEELGILCALADAVQNKKQLTDEQLSVAQQLGDAADTIQYHMPGDAGGQD